MGGGELRRDRAQIPDIIPILPLAGMVIYPTTVMPLAITQAASVHLIDAALETHGYVGLLTRHALRDDVDPATSSAYYSIGCVAWMHRLLRLPDGSLRVAAEGIERFELQRLIPHPDGLSGAILLRPDLDDDALPDEIVRELMRQTDDLLVLLPSLAEDVREQIRAETNPQRLSFLIAQTLLIRRPLAERQAVLELQSPRERIQYLNELIGHELRHVRQHVRPTVSSFEGAQPLAALESRAESDGQPATQTTPAHLGGRFAGKVALITGATRGIGAAAARRLAQEGAQVVICGRSVEDGEQLASILGGPSQALFVRADLSKAEDCAAAVDAAVNAFGRLDVLVNNAASVLRGSLETTTADAFDQMMAINLRAPFLLIQRAFPTFKAQHEREGVGGVVINIGSVNAYIGLPNLMAYSASKGAINTLSKNLAGALTPWLIRVHVLNVGWTLTEGEVLVQRSEGAPEDWATQGGATRPWGRLLDPSEIAAAIAFFASDEARVFSGAVIDLEQFPIGRFEAGK